MNYKEINIGQLLSSRMRECKIDEERILNILNIDSATLNSIFQANDINTVMLLKLSKILDYDFFRLYSQHLLLYAPCSHNSYDKQNSKSSLPIFKKQLYTKEIIDFILKKYFSKEMNKSQIMKVYNIPKSTLHRWIIKYTNDET